MATKSNIVNEMQLDTPAAKSNRLLKMIWAMVFLVGQFFLCFNYFFITKFPIGDDPAAHIRYTLLSWHDLWQVRYPLPEAIFKLAAEIFPKIPLTHLFILIICSFLFFASISLTLLAKRISGSWIIALLAGLIFASERWVNDGLRMGLLAETFGWGVLFLALYFLASKWIIPLVITSFLLPISHPFSTTMFIIIFAIVAFLSIFSRDKNERKFIFWIIGIYVAIFIVFSLFLKHTMMYFTTFNPNDPPGWGERDMFTVLTDGDRRRYLLLVPLIFGIFESGKVLKKWQLRIVWALAIAGSLLSFNQIIGLHFLTFRFFPYFEAAVSIFTSIGIYYIYKKIELKKSLKLAILFPFFTTLIASNLLTNISLMKWQARDITADASLTPSEQKAITWLGDNAAFGSTIAAPSKIALWINALDRKIYSSTCDWLYNPVEMETALSSGKYNYIFWRQSSPKNFFPSNYSSVFNENGVLILKLNSQ